MGGRASMLSQLNLQLMEELGCSKRLTGDCTIAKYKIFIQIIVEIFELPPLQSYLYFPNSNILFFDKNWVKWAWPCCSYFLLILAKNWSYFVLIFAVGFFEAPLPFQSRFAVA